MYDLQPNYVEYVEALWKKKMLMGEGLLHNDDLKVSDVEVALNELGRQGLQFPHGRPVTFEHSWDGVWISKEYWYNLSWNPCAECGPGEFLSGSRWDGSAEVNSRNDALRYGARDEPHVERLYKIQPDEPKVDYTTINNRSRYRKSFKVPEWSDQWPKTDGDDRRTWVLWRSHNVGRDIGDYAITKFDPDASPKPSWEQLVNALSKYNLRLTGSEIV